MTEPYVPRDALFLWWLGQPDQPLPIGEIMLGHGGRAVGLRYGADWLRSGFALSEDLPLAADVFWPSERDSAVGALEDARPDRWGERVIKKFEVTPRLSLLEFLLFAGDDRYGALGVSQTGDEYRPWDRGPTPTFGDLHEMAEVVRKVLANEPVPEVQRRLIRPGASLGGARPKSLVYMDGAQWLVKFPEDDEMDTPLVEHATMTLSAACGIAASRTRALRLGDRHAVAILRFDRKDGARLHAVSANVALRAAGESLGYPQLAQLLRRIAPADSIGPMQEQLFRRMVFNILIDNTDDHEKNHAVLRQANGSFTLAPAFDVVPTAQGLGYQQMTVGERGAESSLVNAMSSCNQFGLRPPAAHRVIEQIITCVESWKAHFHGCGVRDRDIDYLARFIDRDWLRDQRRDFSARSASSTALRRGGRQGR